MFRTVIVEDEEIVRKGLILTTIWSDYDMKVIGEAKNGREGLLLCEKLRPDIIITDIRMPYMDGITMVEEICRIYAPVVIMLTAFCEFEYAKKCIELDVSDYLVKPFQDEQLDKVLKKAVNKVKEGIFLKSMTEDGEDFKKRETMLKISVNSKHANIKRAVLYIEENYMKDINVRQTAEELNVSESYLSHLFKQEMDYTFLEYLTSVRLRKACELLKEPSVRVNEVAQAVGYRDGRYFSHIFKKHLKVSPNFYKENI